MRFLLRTLHEIPADKAGDKRTGYLSLRMVCRNRVPAEARKRREMFYIDATCPLVSKVHRGGRATIIKTDVRLF